MKMDKESALKLIESFTETVGRRMVVAAGKMMEVSKARAENDNIQSARKILQLLTDECIDESEIKVALGFD